MAWPCAFPGSRLHTPGAFNMGPALRVAGGDTLAFSAPILVACGAPCTSATPGAGRRIHSAGYTSSPVGPRLVVLDSCCPRTSADWAVGRFLAPRLSWLFALARSHHPLAT